MDEKKLVIDIFRTKTADDFTKAIADPDGKLETGSAAADAAAIAAATSAAVVYPGCGSAAAMCVAMLAAATPAASAPTIAAV